MTGSKRRPGGSGTSVGDRILPLWRRLVPLPFGTRLFSFVLGRMVPYTSTIRPHVVELEPGRVRAEMSDRRRVRNHLGSVHAIALANLGELVTGLATVTALPSGTRGIAVRFEIDYRKKARGTLTAECATEPPGRIDEPLDHVAEGAIRNEDGDVVARIRATWRVAPSSDVRDAGSQSGQDSESSRA